MYVFPDGELFPGAECCSEEKHRVSVAGKTWAVEESMVHRERVESAVVVAQQELEQTDLDLDASLMLAGISENGAIRAT